MKRNLLWIPGTTVLLVFAGRYIVLEQVLPCSNVRPYRRGLAERVKPEVFNLKGENSVFIVRCS
jgi:hypothetical protein